MSRHRVSVVILAYGAEDWLHAAVATTLASRGVDDLELIVVDNGCTCDAVATLAPDPRLRVLTPSQNTGFAGGINLGFTAARGDILVMLNSDAEVQPDTMARLVTAIDEGADLAGAVILLAGTEERVNSAGNPLHVLGLAWAGHLDEPRASLDLSQEAACLSGACLALRAFPRRRIARPFAALRAFAADVAAGNLDAPLTMDRGNLFGPFTEAFDIMRDELARARRREEEAKQSKKDLVAELGHDIRTPVASIAATAELLALTETDAARRSKLETVGGLTGQIEALVADLFQANEEELAVLRVEPEVVASGEVAALLRAADPDGAIRPFHLPGCLVSVDRLRMRQVFDNVVANSRKYAATPVTVASRLEGDFLVVDVRDTGPGVPSGELEAILGKGVRGSNAEDRPGQGLGLFTASYLMERMGGSLHCRDAAPGLGVVVEMPLAR